MYKILIAKLDSRTYDFSSVIVVDHIEKGIGLGDLLNTTDVLEAQSFD